MSSVDDETISRRLFLLDGSSLAFRAFFALPETISTREGLPTNALYGFSQMLLKLVDRFRPAALVVAWDAREKTFRHDEYEEYKAHRPHMPEGLSRQWPLFRELTAAFGIPDLEVPGYEADDILGTLAERARQQGLGVAVVTGDRDALQLVDERIAVVTTGRGVTDVKVYTPGAVVERYGIPPERVPDFIGLKGDSSDNIPGVPGIGEKTAAQLLQQFGSIEALYERLDEVSSPKRRALLAQHEAAARLSKRLATMVLDVPIEMDLGELVANGPYTIPQGPVGDIFARWEFATLARRVRGAAGPGVAGPGGEAAEAAAKSAGGVPQAAGSSEPPPLHVEHALGTLASLLEQEPRGFSVEPVRQEDAQAPSQVAVAVVDGQAAVASLASLDGLRGLWRLAAHMVSHDVKSLPLAATAAAGPAADTMVAAYLLVPERPQGDLHELAGVDDAWAVVAPARQPGSGDAELSAAQAAALSSAATRAVLAQRVAASQEPRLEEMGLGRLYRETELPLIRVLAQMEAAGVLIDTYRLGEITARLREQVDELTDRIYELAGGPFTVGSPKQLADVLFSRLGLAPVRKGKTGYSTDARVLASLRDQHPVVPAVEQWRELTKLLNTYLEPLPQRVDPKTGRLHGTFNQTVTATGRLSSSDPNLQNIPARTPLGAEIRSCFVAQEGCQLVVADYSQIELRLMAWFAGEEALLEFFRRGEDVHRATAAAVAGIPVEDVTPQQRERAKATNFGIMYGLSAYGLSEQVGMSVDEARDFIAAYFARYPAVAAFRQQVIAQATEDGFVRTVLGRRRAIPELRASVQHVRSLGERLAVNTLLQGSAADIIKVAMIRVVAESERRGSAARLLLQVHDELVFEAPADEVPAVIDLARDTMCDAYQIDPPLEVHVGAGSNWRDAK